MSSLFVTPVSRLSSSRRRPGSIAPQVLYLVFVSVIPWYDSRRSSYLSSRGTIPGVLLTCHPGARGPRKNECFCGVLVDHGIQVNRCPVRQHRQQRFVSLRDGLINLGPGVKHRGDRGARAAGCDIFTVEKNVHYGKLLVNEERHYITPKRWFV